MRNTNRAIDILETLRQKSCFLLGPRQTGKTYLIRQKLSDYKVYNLLNAETFFKLSQSPHRLYEEIQPSDEIVIIDEIQKLPVLLDEIHSIIEEKGVHFLLTGSSARKLRSQGTNLLGGRARLKQFHPFIYQELQEDFNLTQSLDIGSIPSIYFSESPHEDLQAYVGLYLQEEIATEALIRNVPGFSRFLTVAGLSNGHILNYSKIASDVEVPKSVVQEYFQILRDTLIGVDLPAWTQTTKRKSFSTSKFYLFDVGVARFLQSRKNLQPGSPEYGEAFEAYMHHELRTYCDYTHKADLAYWRSTSQFEVDFILGDHTAIEVKAKTNVTERDLKGLRALKEEQRLKEYVVVSLEDTPRIKDDGIRILPWNQFLEELWEHRYVL